MTLYATLGEEGLKYGLEETKATMLLTSEALLERFPKNWHLYNSRIHTVVYFPTLHKPVGTPVAVKALEVINHNKVTFLSYAQFEDVGTKSKVDDSLYSLATTRITEDTPAVILYTR